MMKHPSNITAKEQITIKDHIWWSNPEKSITKKKKR